DFTVTEDGVPQTIAFLEYQTLDEKPEAAIPVAYNAPVAARERFAKTQIAPERAGDIRYRDRRLLAMYFDMSAMPPGDQIRAFTAAQKFVRTQMTPADLVAIMMYAGGAVQVLEDFTADRERLLSTLQTLIIGEDENAPEVNDAASSDKGAAF